MSVDDAARRMSDRLERRKKVSERRLEEATDDLTGAFRMEDDADTGSSGRSPAPPVSEKRAPVQAQAASPERLTDGAGEPLTILHLSDLHLETVEQARIYRTQLETDLIRELGVERLDYVVISGDIANRAEATDYEAADHFVGRLMRTFHLDAGRVIAVPGNHDVNWERSKQSYGFVFSERLPNPLPADRAIPAGESGALLRDDARYRDRFAVFGEEFHARLYSGQRYPPDYDRQVQLVKDHADRVLFLGLNSCWQVDHHFTRRAGIHMPALSRALDSLQREALDGWLKVAIWHHPVSGKEMMDEEFLELLEAHGFHLCMHGHIHEAIEVFHKYDERRGLYIVGAGAFGAPTKENPESSIPLQYNLLAYDPARREVVVHTRRKEKPNGSWSADARWGDRHAPVPWYRIQLRPS